MKRPPPGRRRRRWRWLLWLGLLLPLLSWLPVLALRWLDPPTSAFIWHAEREAAAGGRSLTIDYRWRDRAQISAEFALAVIAAEDQRFPQHAGFDLAAIRAALDASGGQGRGASTLSQQVAKNLFLWPDRSWWRKGLEAWFTLAIEALWPKPRILEVYCNIAELGPGIYGVEAAAQRYFGVAAADLDRRQAARLAAVLPSPRRWSVLQPGPYVQRRVRWIERQMRQLGDRAYLREVW